MSKQDRQGARTASDLVQRYNFGKSFAEVMGFATDAQEAAAEANASAKAASEAVNSLDQEEIFNRLTNNGQAQGLFRDEDGELYINASYIASGILSSADGTVQLDLANNVVTIKTVDDETGAEGKLELTTAGILGYTWDTAQEKFVCTLRLAAGGYDVTSADGGYTQTVITSHSSDAGLTVTAAKMGATMRLGVPGTKVAILNKTVSWKDNGDGTYSLIGT